MGIQDSIESKKVASLNFYAVVIFYRILKAKFANFYFDRNMNFSDHYISISRVEYENAEPGEIILEIHSPFVEECSLDEMDKLDLETQKIIIKIFIHSADSLEYSVNPSAFDESEFIDGLKNLIGKIMPGRRKSGNWNNEVLLLARKEIESSVVSKYLTPIWSD